MRSGRFVVLLLIGLLTMLMAVPHTSAGEANTERLREAVTVDNIVQHLEVFQTIADANGGRRASGTPGYAPSADYVVKLLEQAGYIVTRQAFTFPFFEQLAPGELERISPDPETYTAEEDFLTARYSGNGAVMAEVQPVDVVIPPGAEPNTSTSGCEAEDFADFEAGNIVLIQRGTCPFQQKVENATAAGAAAVILFNEGQEGRTDADAVTLGVPQSLPTVSASFAVGQELYTLTQDREVVVRIATATVSEDRTTENVIAETRKGKADQVVVVGAHLDSVLEGPGINDNGSGSATILEVALQIARLNINPKNTVRFIWFGAEEGGLLGSEYYVDQLSEEARGNIIAMLNFDMVGSPNYVRFVYDGDNSTGEGAEGPEGSAFIEQVFVDYFNGMDLASEPTPFNGRSDYGPFIAIGIPAGGLFTGAEEIKTEAQAATYGGIAGVAHDPCYHEACDSLHPDFDAEQAAIYAALEEDYTLSGNANLNALDEMSDAVAHAVAYFATTRRPFNEPGKTGGANAYGLYIGHSMIK